MMRRLVCALTLFLSTTWAAFAEDRPRVIAVNHALQMFAERLLGDAAEVVFPVPANVDPSFWRPSIADISMIQSADLILLNGAGFATWVDRVSLPRSRLVNTTAAIEDQFIVTESITHSHGDGGEHSHEGLASYTWLDPMLAAAQAEAIATATIARGLAPEADVKARLEELRADLAELDTAAMDKLKDAQGIAIIATHPRYQYFAHRYGLSITSLEWEAGAMPTGEELADLENLATELGARVLIWEAQPPREAIEAAEALGLQSVVFDPMSRASGEPAYSPAFSDAVADLAKALQNAAQ